MIRERDSKGSQVVLGLGNTVDYELLWDSYRIQRLINQYGITSQEITIHPASIQTERELILSILYFFKNGLGGERFVSCPRVIDRFVEHFSYNITLGGSGLRAGLALARLGIPSVIHLTSYNRETEQRLPQAITYISSSNKESLYPHVIVQFTKGDTVQLGEEFLIAPASNRIIYNNDKVVMELLLASELPQAAREAEVLLLSGFNAMQDTVLLHKRLDEVIDIMRSLPKRVHTFYEDACFHNKHLAFDVAKKLAPYVSVYSLNTDEFQEYLGYSLDLTDAKNIYKGITCLYERIGCKTMVLHSKYWALAYGENAQEYKQHLQGGVTLASTRFLYGDDYGKEEYQNMIGRKKDPHGIVFSNAINQYVGVCAVPVPDVWEVPATTVGLGDTFVGGFLSLFLSDEL